MLFSRRDDFDLLEDSQQGIERLVRLTGYGQPVLDLVIFDRTLRLRSEDSILLTGIDAQPVKGILNRPDLVVTELNIEAA